MMTTKFFVPTHSQLRQKRLFKNVLKIDGLSLKFEIENTFYPFSGLNNKLKFQIHPMVKSAANNTSRIPKIYEKEAGDGAYKNYRMLNTCISCQQKKIIWKRISKDGSNYWQSVCGRRKQHGGQYRKTYFFKWANPASFRSFQAHMIQKKQHASVGFEFGSSE